jgi:hypothetical protein
LSVFLCVFRAPLQTIKKLPIMDKQNILDAVNEWLTASFDEETQEAVKT